MNCTVCGKEFDEGDKAYATAVGSLESFLIEDDIGFFASEVEPWLTVLCEDCGLKVHNLIAKLQAREA